MDITTEKKENYNLLKVSGRLDSTTALEFEKSLLNFIESGKENIVDFSDLKYISSSGLRVLLVAAKKLSDANEKLTIVSMQDHIKEVFDISGFTDIFNILPENPHE
jgi:anti-anti-sigma factor